MVQNGVGKLSVDKVGNTSLMICNDEWCAVKDFADKTITVKEKTDTNYKESTPEYCFEVQEVAVAESYDINLENCKEYASYDYVDETDQQLYCTKGQVASDGYSLEIKILVNEEDITELVNDNIIENVVYKEVTEITDYKCYEGNNDGYEVITDVVIPSRINNKSISIIGEYAFSGYDLTSVVIPDSVTIIERYAFDCNQLTSITIPNSVTTIGDGAFWSNQLTSVTISNSVTTIGHHAFNDNQLPDDQAFIYARNSDGSEDKTKVVNYGGAKRDNVVIPNSVTTIGPDAFYDNQLTSVTIPNSVTEIRTGAFLKSSSSNPSLITIVNTTGRVFDWVSITGGWDSGTFVTGTVRHSSGDITVTDS